MASLEKSILSSSKLSSERFLSDGIRKIDYVIVVEEENLQNLEPYLDHLENIGIEYEIVKGIVRIFNLVLYVEV